MIYRILQDYPHPVQARTYEDDDMPGKIGPCEQSAAIFFSGHARTVGGYVTLDFNAIVCSPQPFRGMASFVATPNVPDAPAVPPPPILITDITGAVVKVRSVNVIGERIDVEFSWHCALEI